MIAHANPEERCPINFLGEQTQDLPIMSWRGIGDLVYLRLSLQTLSRAPAIKRLMYVLWLISVHLTEAWARRRKNSEERKQQRWTWTKRQYRMVYSRHCDYFVHLYALNHPVGFLSRVDGSRSRIKACGLLRASIMTQSTIHLAPTLLTARRYLSFSFFPDFFSCRATLSPFILQRLYTSVRLWRTRRQEICGFSRDRLLYTVSFAAVFFKLLPTTLYLCLLVLLLPPLLHLLCDRPSRSQLQRR